MNRPLLASVLPEVAQVIRTLLIGKGLSQLALQVPSLRFFDCCPCGEPGCASFYTAPHAGSPLRPADESVMLDATQGLLALDVVDRRIVFVEMLNRRDVRAKLEYLADVA